VAKFASLPNAFFKFVVQSPADLQEIELLIEEFEISRRRVLLMPEATDSAQLAERTAWLAGICIERRFRLGYRLHVALWGTKRGV
jgi:organic radical activating enzyme